MTNVGYVSPEDSLVKTVMDSTISGYSDSRGAILIDNMSKVVINSEWSPIIDQ